MLILSRKIDEKIKIGNDITITLIDVHGDQVKIGVEAPKDVKVFRQEVFDAIQNENKAAVVAVPAKDTIKLADPDGFSEQTLQRDKVWLMQTPQVFDFYEIYEAYSKLIESEKELIEKGVVVTDDAMVLEMFSDTKVKFVMGDYGNIKVTTPEDITIMNALMSR